MPDPSDFQQIADNPPGGDKPIPELENLRQALSGMREFQARLKVTQEASAVPSPPEKISMSTDPKTKQRKVTVETSQENYEATTGAAMKWHTALGQMAKSYEEVEQRLAAQEQAIRNQPPWVQLATALSANLAQAKDMPGWVQAAGRTAAQLNPRPEEIQARRLGVLGEEAKLAERGQASAMEQQRMIQADVREQRLTESAHATQTAKTFQELAQAAQKGELSDVSLTSTVFRQSGMPEKEADSKAAALVGISTEKKALLNAADAAKDKRVADDLRERARESDNRLAVILKGIAVKASDKSDADKAIEAVAQSIAKGDLSSIRDITTFRSQERSKIYARALEINPKFSVSETQRKIDTLKSFEVGKDSLALQSFGTFLEHAGELNDTLDTLYQSRSPALNKPMNWIRKNAEGNPEYQKLLVALEPVGKEFESFLLNNRALYLEDRRQIAELMNGNSSPLQIRAALNQMAKTAKDRFTEMNHRYKKVLKQDIPDPFSPQAATAAAKIGIDLPQATEAKGEKRLVFNPDTGKVEEK